MGSNLSICGYIILVLLVLLNILFVLFGLVLIGVGSWLIATDNSFAFITGNNIISGAALLIVAGIVVFLICIAGIIGAIFKWRPVLVVYAVVVGIVVILEIVAGIVAIVVRNSFANTVDDLADDAYREYHESQRARAFVVIYQDTFECCGYNNASDWIRLNPTVLSQNAIDGVPAPPFYVSDPTDGCYQCDPATEGCATFTGIINNDTSVSFNVTTKGCSEDVHNFVVVATSVVGALGILFGLIESLGVIFALVLCCFITSAGDSNVV